MYTLINHYTAYDSEDFEVTVPGEIVSVATKGDVVMVVTKDADAEYERYLYVFARPSKDAILTVNDQPGDPDDPDSDDAEDWD